MSRSPPITSTGPKPAVRPRSAHSFQAATEHVAGSGVQRDTRALSASIDTRTTLASLRQVTVSSSLSISTGPYPLREAARRAEPVHRGDTGLVDGALDAGTSRLERGERIPGALDALTARHITASLEGV